MADSREERFRICSNAACGDIDIGHYVLHHGGFGPKELARLAIERVDDSRFSGNTRHHLAPFSRPDPGIDPSHVQRARRNSRVDEQAFERMIEIPMIDDMLVVPHDLSGIGVQRESRVVIQVREIIPSEHEFGRR